MIHTTALDYSRYEVHVTRVMNSQVLAGLYSELDLQVVAGVESGRNGLQR